MNKNLRQPLSILSLIFILILFISFNSSHPTSGGGRTGAPGDGVCMDCHTSVSATIDGSIVISGIPASVDAGTTYNLTITANFTSGSPTKSGFQLLALLDSNDSNAGTWTNNSSNTSIKTSGGRSYVGHQPATLFAGNTSISWTVDWTAPSVPADDITFYAVALLANGNGNNGGDKAKYTTVTTSLIGAFDPIECQINSSSDITCAGDDDGTATVTANAGDGNYSYEWDNGQTTATATNLSPGTHTVTVTDGTGSTTCDIVINSPDLLIVIVDTEDALCFDSNLGTATANVTGGTSPFSYTWSNGGPDNFFISNLSPGDYMVTVTDGNSCIALADFTIEGPNSPVVGNIVSQTNATCEGQENGSATVLATGGTSPYTYFWPFNNTNGDTQNDLAPGTYTVEISDDNNCLILLNIEIEFEFTLTFSVDEVNSAGCSGAGDGSATVSADNGTPEYTYNWSNGGIGATQTGLAPGLYTITATDAEGCTITGEVDISEEDNEPPYFTQDSLILDLDNNGFATLTLGDITEIATDNCELESVNATIPNYDCSNIGDNTLLVDLLDINDNQVTLPLNIIVIDDISPEITCPSEILSSSCEVIVYDMPGATDNCNEVTIELVSGLPSGVVFPVGTTTNTFKATDSSGNESTCSFDVTIESSLSLSYTTENTSCFGSSDGSIDVTASGGTPGYTTTYPGDGNNEQLAAGDYTVTVSDNGGCSVVETITISQPDSIIVEVIVTDVSCFNYNDGSLVFNISGGTAPYEIDFMNGQDYTMLTAKTYSFDITDINNCLYNGSVTVSQPEVLLITNHEITDASSSTSNDGSISIEVTGGVSPYNYNWILDVDQIVSTEMNLTNAVPGTYTCTVTDINGCIFNSMQWVVSYETAVKTLNNDKGVDVFPNPSQGFFNIKLDNTAIKSYNLSIINNQGLTIHKEIINQNDGQATIDLTQIQSGFYFLQLTINKEVITKKVFIL